MVGASILGVPHDENSSFMRGAAEAPGHIRKELYLDAYSLWSETGINLGVAGALVDSGDSGAIKKGGRYLLQLES